MPQNEGPASPPCRDLDIVVGLTRCRMMHMFKQNKGAHIESETGKDTLTQGAMLSTG